MNRSLFQKCVCNKRCLPNAVWEKIKIVGGVDQYESPKSYNTKTYWSGPECKRPKVDPKFFDLSLGRLVSFSWSKIDPTLVKFCKDIKD